MTHALAAFLCQIASQLGILAISLNAEYIRTERWAKPAMILFLIINLCSFSAQVTIAATHGYAWLAAGCVLVRVVAELQGWEYTQHGRPSPLAYYVFQVLQWSPGVALFAPFALGVMKS